jgi:hypothetical protein
MTAFAVACLAVICLGLIVSSYLLHQSFDRALHDRDAAHSRERAQWAAERKELMDHNRYLNDRYLAKHAQDAVMMDRWPDDNKREKREVRQLIPEGL